MSPGEPTAAWTALLDEFAAYTRGVSGFAEPTVANHRTYLRAFAAWWQANHAGKPPTAATAAMLADFLVAEAERGIAPRTRRSELGALRRFYDWLLLTGAAATNPAASLESPRLPPLNPEIYTAAQIRAILDHTAALTDVRGRQRNLIVAMLRFTGMRSAELRTLRRDALDLDAGRARVLGKGARARVVLLPPPLIAILRTFVAEVRPQLPASPLLLANAHPFVTTPQSGFGQEALAREVEVAGLGAQVPGRHFPHKWRHTYATELVRAGVDIHVVQRLLGHQSIAATVGYTHLSLDDLHGTLAQVWS